MKPFWLVWRKNGGVPYHEHETYEEAATEARRLASKHGAIFWVLRAVGYAERSEPPAVYTEIEDV